MADFESTSAVAETENVTGTSEVAEPTEVTGVEEQESPEPVSEESPEPRRTKEDAAWARMRREAEQARKDAEAARQELAELKASNEARTNAISRLTGRGEDAEIAALAEVTGLSEDEVAEIYEREVESAQKDRRIEQLEEMVSTIQGERLYQADLDRLRKIDPSLKDLESLGDEYMRYMSAVDPETGAPVMEPEDAYWAIKAKQRANQATPPKEVGKVATGTAEKTKFSDAEIDAMSSDQLKKNWKKILASWDD